MRAGRVLIISENAPVPADRRVWNISRTLAAAGWQVVIACAQGTDRDDAPYEVLEGIEIHRYPLRPAGSTLGYAREYGQALWRLRKLVRRLSRERRFDVVHACNPPDLLLLAARSLRRQGTRFIFDHHDLVPELYRSRFGRGEDLGYRATLRAERVAYRMADVSLATNGSYARVAVERGGMDPEDVFVVRNGPDLTRFRPVRARPGVAPRARPPDLLPRDHGPAGRRRPRAARPRRAAGACATTGTRSSSATATRCPPCARWPTSWRLGDHVEFAGWRGDDDIRLILSSSDVCLAPDPPSPLNDVSTMIKIPEYMALGRAVASYALPESRVSAGDSALYAAPGDPDSLGRCVAELLDDPARRERMGALARERVETELSWQHSEGALLAAYARVLSRPAPSPAPPRALPRGPTFERQGRRLRSRPATRRRVSPCTASALGESLRTRPGFVTPLPGAPGGRSVPRRGPPASHVERRSGLRPGDGWVGPIRGVRDGFAVCAASAPLRQAAPDGRARRSRGSRWPSRWPRPGSARRACAGCA